ENLGFAEESFLYVGGTAAAPLKIKTSSDYVFDNPHAGKSVAFIPQIQIAGNDGVVRWIDTLWIYENNYTWGVNVTITSDGKIGIFAGAESLLSKNSGNRSGLPYGFRPPNDANVVEAPFRLRLIK
ncbi:hypothetical protein, partial [Brenneria corticis]